MSVAVTTISIQPEQVGAELPAVAPARSGRDGPLQN